MLPTIYFSSTIVLTPIFLLVLSMEWMGMGVAGIIIDSYCGSFPQSLRLAPVSLFGCCYIFNIFI